jgi:hypothetical protein
MGVRRIEDPQHPRGYRELRSNGEIRKLLDRKIAAQNGICGICKEKFTDYSDVVPDHISPRGMGGAWRDDHPDNIQAVHWWCNGEKGSGRGRRDQGSSKSTHIEKVEYGIHSTGKFIVRNRSRTRYSPRRD